MKTMKRLLIVASTFLFALSGCNKKTVPTSESSPSESSETSETSEPQKNVYNIIMTAATLPPVISALECIKNNYPTYAYIERGKTYAGIELLENSNFHNIGFNPTQNNSNGVTDEAFELIINKVKELKQVQPDAHFNLFTTDYKPWAAVKVASDSKLSKSNFTIYMVEDGTATYDYVKKYFVTPFSDIQEADSYYSQKLLSSINLFNEAMISSNKIEEKKNGFAEGYRDTFALSTNQNFVHVMQDKTKLQSSLAPIEGSIIYKNYLNENGASNVIYKSVSERVKELNEEEKTNYLNLMFGSYKDEAYRLLTRTMIDNNTHVANSKKLIYIGTRARQSNKGLIPSVTFTNLTKDFDALPNTLREFFMVKEDYDFVYEYLHNESNYEDGWKDSGADVKNAIMNAAFNTYIGFAYNLKITQRLYGGEYDVLFKGHPAETFESIESWKDYKVTVNEEVYTYNTFMYNLAKMFHTQDSEGQFIGVLPGGVAAENLAYLGVDTYVCGLPSSTYTGYEKTSPILFVLNTIDDDINADGNIIQRYLDGELVWEEDGKTIETVFMNKGVVYQTLANYYGTINSVIYNSISASYQNKYITWLKQVTGLNDVSNCSIDNNGTIIMNEDDIKLAIKVRENQINDYVNSLDQESLTSVQLFSINELKTQAINDLQELTTIYFMNKVVKEFIAAVQEIVPSN